jgi:hypothetical protein
LQFGVGVGLVETRQCLVCTISSNNVDILKKKVYTFNNANDNHPNRLKNLTNTHR